MLMRASARVANTAEIIEKATRARNAAAAVWATVRVQRDHKLLADFVSDVDRMSLMTSPMWLLDHQRMSDGLAAIWGDRVYRTSANALLSLGQNIFGRRSLNALVLPHSCVNDAQSALVIGIRATTSARNETNSSGSWVFSTSVNTSKKEYKTVSRS